MAQGFFRAVTYCHKPVRAVFPRVQYGGGAYKVVNIERLSLSEPLIISSSC